MFPVGGSISIASGTQPGKFPHQLGRYFVEKLGVQWDSITDGYTLEHIDSVAVQRFLEFAKNRLPFAKNNDSVEAILEKLGLIHNGKVTRGAVLLFGKDPQALFTSAQIHMGRFKDDITIVDDKILKGNLFASSKARSSCSGAISRSGMNLKGSPGKMSHSLRCNEKRSGISRLRPCVKQ